MNQVPKKKTGRPRTGSVVWQRGQWYARITLEDGSRKPVPLDPAIARDDVEGARACARSLSELAMRLGGVSDAISETVKEYSERWFRARRERGLATVDDDTGRFRKWVLPRLGNRPMRELGRAVLEDFVEWLDGQVRADKLSWKTAIHVWMLVRRMFKDACSAKRRDLRVREDNPADNVAAPDKGAKKTKVFLYPSELLRLVSCSDVPLEWRRTFAVVTYLYLRAGEGHALAWEDVDLEHGFVHVHQSAHRQTGRLKATKTNAARRVPIEPMLLPLLVAMKDEANGTGPVLATKATDRKFSRQLRRCLKLAGVTRAELFVDDATRSTRKAMTFHDLRATGITWRIVRGDDHMAVRDHAGHSTITTTEGYIRTANGLRGPWFGTPFPALPENLYASAERTPPTEPSPSEPSPREGTTAEEEKRNRVLALGSGFGAARFTKRLVFRRKRWRRRESKLGAPGSSNSVGSGKGRTGARPSRGRARGGSDGRRLPTTERDRVLVRGLSRLRGAMLGEELDAFA